MVVVVVMVVAPLRERRLSVGRSDLIMQTLYETVDHLPVKDRRYRAIDFALAARKAERQDDRYSATVNYERAAKELRSCSNDRAHKAALDMDAEAHRLRNGG